MEIWTAFLIGLGGSFHCIGMCGPLAVALPGYGQKNLRFILGRLVYNSGRLVTYACLGGFFGLVGKEIKMAGFQQSLSILLGTALIVGTLAPLAYRQKLLSAAPLIAAITALKTALARLFRHKSLAVFFPIGLLNGLLPCGMVYLALAGAIAAGTPLGGMSYMAAFGAGTLPLMLAASLAGGLITPSVRHLAHRLLPVGAILLGALFVLRGLALDIPFISPPNPNTPTAMHHHH